MAAIDPARSDALAEEVLLAAPDTDMAYERLMQNARLRNDDNAARRIGKRYQQAAAQFDFGINPRLLAEQNRTARRQAT
jgi:phosphosulfolactate phosphohydrolase-like enzyme